MRPKTSWLSAEFWVCREHMGGLRLPAAATECYYRGCSSVRPDMNMRPEPVPEPVVEVPIIESGINICAWHSCHEVARSGSKYCSRRCSNRNARQRHRQRKREAA